MDSSELGSGSASPTTERRLLSLENQMRQMNDKFEAKFESVLELLQQLTAKPTVEVKVSAEKVDTPPTGKSSPATEQREEIDLAEDFSFTQHARKSKTKSKSYDRGSKERRMSLTHFGDPDGDSEVEDPDVRNVNLRPTPVFKEVLDSLKVKRILEVIDAIFAHRRKHNYKIDLATIVSDSVREKIILASRNPTLSSYEWSRLNDSKVSTMIREAAMPKTKVQWSRDFKEATVFPPLPSNYGPGLTSFGVFYEASLKYIIEFQKVYDFLKDANADFVPDLWSTDKIPGARNADETILGILLAGFPGNMGPNLHKIFVGKKRPTSLKEYLMIFKEGLTEHNSKVLVLYPLSLALYEWRKTTTNAVHALEDAVASDEDTDSAEVYALAPLAKTLSEQPCFKALRGVPCDAKCGRSHDSRVLAKARDQEIERLKNVKYDVKLPRPYDAGHDPCAKALARHTDLNALTSPSVLRRPNRESSNVAFDEDAFDQLDAYDTGDTAAELEHS